MIDMKTYSMSFRHDKGHHSKTLMMYVTFYVRQYDDELQSENKEDFPTADHDDLVWSEEPIPNNHQ